MSAMPGHWFFIVYKMMAVPCLPFQGTGSSQAAPALYRELCTSIETRFAQVESQGLMMWLGNKAVAF